MPKISKPITTTAPTSLPRTVTPTKEEIDGKLLEEEEEYVIYDNTDNEDDDEDDDNMADNYNKAKKHLSKDGKIYSTYLEMVTANRKYNQNVLEKKGLLDAVQDIRKRNTVKRKSSSFIKTRRGTTISPSLKNIRRSKRIRSSVPDNYGLSMDANLHYNDLSVLTSTNTRKKRHTAVSADDRQVAYVDKPLLARKNNSSYQNKKVKGLILEPLTKEERDQLHKKYPDPKEWIKDMPEFLLNVNNVSIDNAKAVMKQVNILITPNEGITYRHWQNHKLQFMKKQIHIGMDFTELYNDAIEYENKYGRDKGNGWLVRHPIRKLELFQQYYYQKKILKK